MLVAGLPNLAAADDLPRMSSVGHETEDFTLSVICEQTAPRKAVCSITQVIILQPEVDAAERAKEMAELDKHARSKDGEAEFKKACRGLQKENSQPQAPFEKQLRERMRAACAAQDAQALGGALRWWREEIVDRTCKLSVFSERVEFTQVNAKTWRSISTANLCDATVVRTLSRKANSDVLWVYEQVRTVPASSSNDLCKNTSGETTATRTYGKAFHRGPRELRCRYWE